MTENNEKTENVKAIVKKAIKSEVNGFSLASVNFDSKFRFSLSLSLLNNTPFSFSPILVI